MSDMNINYAELENQLQELENSQASLLEVSKSLGKSVIDALLWGGKDSYALRLCRVVPAFRNILEGIFGNTVRLRSDSISVLAPTQAKELYKSFRSETKLEWEKAEQFFMQAKTEKAEIAKAEKLRRAQNATESEILADIRKQFERLQKKYVNVDVRALWDKI